MKHFRSYYHLVITPINNRSFTPASRLFFFLILEVLKTCSCSFTPKNVHLLKKKISPHQQCTLKKKKIKKIISCYYRNNNNVCMMCMLHQRHIDIWVQEELVLKKSENHTRYLCVLCTFKKKKKNRWQKFQYKWISKEKKISSSILVIVYFIKKKK